MRSMSVCACGPATVGIVVSLSVMAFPGCSDIESGHVWAPQSAAIRSLGTSYAWMPLVSPAASEGQIFERQFREMIQMMVENAFNEKCYEQTTVRAADFWIGCQMKREILGTPYTAGSGFADYTEGTLVIYIVDPHTSRYIWRGWASARLRKDYPPENKRERLQKAIDKIMSEFPSRDKPLRKGED